MVHICCMCCIITVRLLRTSNCICENIYHVTGIRQCRMFCIENPKHDWFKITKFCLLFTGHQEGCSAHHNCHAVEADGTVSVVNIASHWDGEERAWRVLSQPLYVLIREWQHFLSTLCSLTWTSHQYLTNYTEMRKCSPTLYLEGLGNQKYLVNGANEYHSDLHLIDSQQTLFPLTWGAVH